MKYRSRSEIIAVMLQAANKGSTKTRIMYSAYLSYAQVKEYLGFLQSKGLLTYEEGTQLYKLTEKGLQYLCAFDQISQMIAVNGGGDDEGSGGDHPGQVSMSVDALQAGK